MAKDNKNTKSILTDEYTFKMWHIDTIEYFSLSPTSIGENKVPIHMTIHEAEQTIQN